MNASETRQYARALEGVQAIERGARVISAEFRENRPGGAEFAITDRAHHARALARERDPNFRPVTMADLKPGTTVRHIHWGICGEIRETGGVREIAWDGSFVQDEVSPEGVVFPSDLEILSAA